MNKLRTEFPKLYAKHNGPIDPGLFVANAGKERGNSEVVGTLLSFDKKENFPLFPPFMYRGRVREPRNLFLDPLGPEESFIVLHCRIPMFLIFTGPPLYSLCSFRYYRWVIKHSGRDLGCQDMFGCKYRLCPHTCMFLSSLCSTSLTRGQLYVVLSPDSELSPVGSKSKIPYWQRYYEYKKVLTLHARTPRVERIFNFWNSAVFAGMQETDIQTRTSVSSSDQQALDAFILDLDGDPADDDPPVPVLNTVVEQGLTVERQVRFATTVQEVEPEVQDPAEGK